MIYIERVVTINKGSSSIDEQVILYKGDKNVEIQFHIKNNPFKAKQKDGLIRTYGQLVINREAAPIFSEITQVFNNRATFVITGDMIDEAVECGYYDFQIRLFNEDKTSRITLPPIEDGILIEEPICEEEGVNASTVNYSRAATGEVLDVFDEEGNYNKTVWIDGDLITDSKLNKIEDALDYLVEDANNNDGGGGPITDLEVVNSISMGRTGEVGTNSVALGANCQAGNDNSAIGYGLIANGRQGQCVVGKYNEEVSDALFIVGSGTIASRRKNSFVVKGNSVEVGNIDAKSIAANQVQFKEEDDGKETCVITRDQFLLSTTGYYGADGKDTPAIVMRKDYILINDPNYVPLNDKYVPNKKYVDDAIANIDIPEVDLTGYATKEELNTALGNIEDLLGGI